MTINITNQADWQQLAQDDLNVVVDPMILRCGELFLKGSRGVPDPEETWSLLTKNIYAIGMFFDSLVLNEKIPVFNYGETFDMGLNFDERMLTEINNYGQQVLFDVNVAYSPYNEVKHAAIEELKKIYDDNSEHTIDVETQKTVLDELAIAEYGWHPQLWDIEPLLETDQEKLISGFLLGGLIFTGYAQLLGGDHLLQPKRSRLFLAASLNLTDEREKLEERLFSELKKRAQNALLDVPWLPTFFPYLLSQSETPTDMLKETQRLRESSEVSDYRKWLRRIMNLHREEGRISIDSERDVRTIIQHIDRRLGTIPQMPKAEVSMQIADISFPPAAIPGKVDATPALSRLWGWALASLPGNRYRKLLTRAVIADREFVSIDRKVQNIWKAV